MMMQALEAGGVDLVYSGIRDLRIKDAMSDEKYKANPESLYEIPTPVQAHPGFPQQYFGKALKVLLPPFGHTTTMWPGDYFIIIMRRDPEEVRQSFEAFFAPRGHKWPLSAEVHEGVFESGVQLLTARNDATVVVWDYDKVLEKPLEHFIQIPGIDARAAASVVDPDHYRFQLERLTVGA